MVWTVCYYSSAARGNWAVRRIFLPPFYTTYPRTINSAISPLKAEKRGAKPHRKGGASLCLGEVDNVNGLSALALSWNQQHVSKSLFQVQRTIAIEEVPCSILSLCKAAITGSAP